MFGRSSCAKIIHEILHMSDYLHNNRIRIIGYQELVDKLFQELLDFGIIKPCDNIRYNIIGSEVMIQKDYIIDNPNIEKDELHFSPCLDGPFDHINI